MKQILKKLALQFLFLLLAAWLTGCTAGQTPSVETPSLSPTQDVQPTLTPTQYPGTCSYVWASRSAPEVSVQLKKAFREAKMPEVDVDASAYGENCLDISSNSVVSFSAMQTDLSLDILVQDMSDTTAMGEWIIKVYTLLENLPKDNLPGGKLGNLQVQYEDGKTRVSLSFTHSQGQEAIKQGLRGTRLFDALNAP